MMEGKIIIENVLNMKGIGRMVFKEIEKSDIVKVKQMVKLIED